jgi:hypothetical protein
MAKETPSLETPVVEPSEKRDLSADIASSIERQPGDVVRCTWIGGNSYRVNWWSARSTLGYDNPAMFGSTYGTHVIRQSRFLRVTTTAQGLQISDAAAPETPRGRLL